jgi:hypothetical protein
MKRFDEQKIYGRREWTLIMDCRVKPGNDDGKVCASIAGSEF